MNNREYSFAEDVSFESIGNLIQIQSPWLDMEIENIENLTQKDICKNLLLYPLVIVKPKRQTEIPCFHSDILKSPIEFFDDHFDKISDQKIINFLQNLEWKFNCEEIMKACHLESGIFDSISLYTIIRQRRYNLLSNTNIQLMKEMKLCKNRKEKFHKIVLKLLRHNHYVTQRCQDSISSAVQHEGVPVQDLSEFIAEERGHDLILQKAIRSLGLDPETIEVHFLSVFLMDLLKFTSMKSERFASFCCLLESFEGSSFEEVDPRAEILFQFPEYKEAAQCIQKHHLINLCGNHFSIGMSFLQKYRDLNENEALMAIRICDVVHQVTEKFSEYVLYE